MKDGRNLVPELLDTMPPDDPKAKRSRQDLRRVNRWMFQSELMAGLLNLDPIGEVKSVLDLGSGDGTFMLSVARRLSIPGPVTVSLLDRQDIVSVEVLKEFSRLGWAVRRITDDAARFLAQPGGPRFDLVTANLFLHHFEDAELSRLLKLAALRTERFAACEPARTPLALAGSRMLWAIGCNSVTRFDAVVSVRAGFLGNELGELWPKGTEWIQRESGAGLFSHTFMARRIP
jgi:hypothetical protein